MSRLRGTAAWLLLVGALAGALVAPAAVLAADPDFGKPTIDATFGEGITVTQPVTLDAKPARVELLLT